MMVHLKRGLHTWLARREGTIRGRLEELRSERDSLFAAFEVARQDVAFERSGSTEGGGHEADLRNLHSASERVRSRIRRAERRMARLRRRANRYRDLRRALDTPHGI